MDRPSHEFLASARLALDNNREGRVGHLPDLLDYLLHLPTRAYQPPQRALDSTLCFPQFARALLDGLLQFVRVALQYQLLLFYVAPLLGYLDRPVQRVNEIVPVDRLLNEVVGSAAEGINCECMVTVPGDHQGGRVGPPRAYLGQQRETVRPRHLDVGDYRVVVRAND